MFVKVPLNTMDFVVWSKDCVNYRSAFDKDLEVPGPFKWETTRQRYSFVCVTASRHKLKEMYLRIWGISPAF